MSSWIQARNIGLAGLAPGVFVRDPQGSWWHQTQDGETYRYGLGAGACPDGTAPDEDGNCVGVPVENGDGSDGGSAGSGTVDGQPAGQGQQSGGSGGSPGTPPAPNDTTIISSTTTPTNWTPVIIGGAVVVGGAAIWYAMSKSKGKSHSTHRARR